MTLLLVLAALGAQEETVERLIQAWRSPDPEERDRASDRILRRASDWTEVEGDFAVGRLAKGTRSSLRTALEWLLGRQFAPEVVLDGDTVRLMDRRRALDHWIRRLESK